MKDYEVKVNSSRVRGSALINFIVLGATLAFALSQKDKVVMLLMSYQLLTFYRAAWGEPLKVTKWFCERIAVLFGPGISESSLPVKFSAKIGFFLSLMALLASWLEPLNLVFILLCFVASALNAFTGICIACKLYPRVQIIKSRVSILSNKS